MCVNAQVRVEKQRQWQREWGKKGDYRDLKTLMEIVGLDVRIEEVGNSEAKGTWRVMAPL